MYWTDEVNKGDKNFKLTKKIKSIIEGFSIYTLIFKFNRHE